MKHVARFFTLTSAYLGFLIGSGVATGQELMQYYSPYGFKMFGTAVVISVILIAANYCFSYAGRNGNIDKGGEVFSYYCGPVLGKIIDVFTVIFCYLSFVVMVSGGAATLQQQYGVKVLTGAVAIAGITGVTVALGLNKIVNIIGKITPLMLFGVFVISVICLCKNHSHIPGNIAAIEAGELAVTKAADSWFMSGISNGGFCILWLAGFSATLGKKEDFKLLQKANIASSILLVVINSIIAFSILAKIDVVGAMQIPNLHIAKELWPPLAYMFGILIFAAIYTSACPLLWTPVARFTKENSNAAKVLSAVLASAGVVIAVYIPFNVLMNYIYVINGYLGFIVLAIMLVRMVMVKAAMSKS